MAVLLKILELYNISFSEFNEIHLPLIKTEKIPSSLVRELEDVVSDNFAVLSPNWKENRDKFKKNTNGFIQSNG